MAEVETAIVVVPVVVAIVVAVVCVFFLRL